MSNVITLTNLLSFFLLHVPLILTTADTVFIVYLFAYLLYVSFTGMHDSSVWVSAAQQKYGASHMCLELSSSCVRKGKRNREFILFNPGDLKYYFISQYKNIEIFIFFFIQILWNPICLLHVQCISVWTSPYVSRTNSHARLVLILLDYSGLVHVHF